VIGGDSLPVFPEKEDTASYKLLLFYGGRVAYKLKNMFL
jgi:hypothetical protein